MGKIMVEIGKVSKPEIEVVQDYLDAHVEHNKECVYEWVQIENSEWGILTMSIELVKIWVADSLHAVAENNEARWDAQLKGE